MTPLALEMLIWFHTRAAAAGPFEGLERGPQSEIMRQFLTEGIIEPYDGTSPAHTYRTTDKGRAWLDMILATPQPRLVWADPRLADDRDILGEMSLRSIIGMGT